MDRIGVVARQEEWLKASQEQFNHYRVLLDAYLKSILIPYHLVVSSLIFCFRYFIKIVLKDVICNSICSAYL